MKDGKSKHTPIIIGREKRETQRRERVKASLPVAKKKQMEKRNW